MALQDAHELTIQQQRTRQTKLEAQLASMTDDQEELRKELHALRLEREDTNQELAQAVDELQKTRERLARSEESLERAAWVRGSRAPRRIGRRCLPLCMASFMTVWRHYVLATSPRSPARLLRGHSFLL